MDYSNERLQQKDKETEFEIAGIGEKRKKSRFPMLRVILFVIIIIYFVFTLYRVPLLIKLGNYLVVEHEAQEADLIVCVAGSDLERAPAVIDLFKKDLAPYIFRAKIVEPHGFDYIKGRIEDYPDSYDRFTMILEGFGIPENVILSSKNRVKNITEEAMEVRNIVLDKRFKSIIIVPSRIDSRRTWMIFNKVFKDDEVTIISRPSHYQSFDLQGWWKDPRWVRELVFEYQRLIF